MFLRVVFIIAAFFYVHCSIAQGQNRFAGTWQGVINAGVELRVVFHIKDNGNGSLSATTDSPDQGAFGFKCDTAFSNGNKVTIEMRELNATYNGTLMNDSTIEGSLTQGIEIPLTLTKNFKPTVRTRPQTPKPPYPYKSEDIIYNNSDRSLQYGATITIPEGKGPFPAAILITGSGAQNRNEEIMEHKPFMILADHLTKNGFVILRVDDRGIGKSTGEFEKATSADFAKDVNAGLDYLLSRPEVNKKKIGMIGHSEGGLIAPMVAAGRKDIDFVVLLAGPGVPVSELMLKQNELILASNGISKPAIDAYISFYGDIVNAVLKAKDSVTAITEVKKITAEWSAKTNESILKETGLSAPKSRDELAVSIVEHISLPWYRYFFSFDPVPYLQKLEGKVLALNGEKDIQVNSKQNLGGIEAALKKSKAKKYTIKELPSQNHLFQTCNKCTLQEYGELEESFSPITLKEISEWLIQNVQNN